jgi:hypothetical protein
MVRYQCAWLRWMYVWPGIGASVAMRRMLANSITRSAYMQIQCPSSIWERTCILCILFAYKYISYLTPLLAYYEFTASRPRAGRAREVHGCTSEYFEAHPHPLQAYPHLGAQIESPRGLGDLRVKLRVLVSQEQYRAGWSGRKKCRRTVRGRRRTGDENAGNEAGIREAMTVCSTR